MSEFEKQLAAVDAAMRREKVRCICIFACVTIVTLSMLGAVFYSTPPTTMFVTQTQEPVTYTHTDEAGATVTTTINGSTTTTIVTDSNGRVISACISSGRRRK